MATYSNTLRSGLPRVPGGEPWPSGGVIGSQRPAEEAPVEAASAETPPAEAAPVDAAPTETAPVDTASAETAPVDTASAEAVDSSPAAEPEADAQAEGAAAAAAAPAAAAAARSDVETKTVPLRRGLPRTPGGEPWPPEGVGVITVPSAGAPQTSEAAAPTPAAQVAGAEAAPETTDAASSEPTSTEQSTPSPEAAADTAAPADRAAAGAVPTASAAAGDAGTASGGREIIGESDIPLRRGLPRVAGGEPWPPAGFAPLLAPTASAADAAKTAPAETPEPASESAADASTEAQPSAEAPAEAAPAAAPVEPATQEPAAQPASAEPAADRTPAAEPATQEPTAAKPAAEPAAAQPAAAATAKSPAPAAEKPAAAKPAKAREPIMIGSKSLGQWAKQGGLWIGGLIVAAGIIVLAARGVTTLPGVPEFLERYPGEYHLPEFVEPGFPAWARWTHFLNIFFMVLIIRSGLQVRYQQKPPAYFTPKRGGKKISINLWLHTSLDVLWLINGVVFVVLLFASGHWARIVPTSWEVFPNAVSALLQYMTLEWPAEDAWVNYNSLQQLMYFIVVFIAAPLAAITGVRMSEWWPKEAKTLNRIYPAPLARAIHFPTMVFFVAFILIHVFLVVATGFLQNLNHMFAGRHEVSWVGFGWFVASLAVIVGAWFAARPMLLAPIASLFGRVSTR